MIAETIVLDTPLTWREIASVARGAALHLSSEAEGRITAAREIVEAIVRKNIRGYGINTGVGALCDVIIEEPKQRAFSRNLIMSHACGVGDPLGQAETRAIMAVMVHTYGHGYSGVRLQTVQLLCELLNRGCIPRIRSRGSVGYLVHAAAISLVLIGAGTAVYRDETLSGEAALARLSCQPLVLEAKEGLSLINGTACATGLTCFALSRLEGLLAWADAAAAMSYENLGGQAGTFSAETLAMRRSPGLQSVGMTLAAYLAGSPILAEREGKRTQDPLSLRAIPQVHGAVRDVFDQVQAVVNRELASVTDNPAVSGTPESPVVHSQAHAVGAAMALATDHLAVAVAGLGAISERRIDRLVNPLVSKLPAFLTIDNGVCSGFQIVQCTAASLVAENRRLASPASLDGGITAALQEDMLTHATLSAQKLLAIIDNLEDILAIELLAAAQAYDLQPEGLGPAPGTMALRRTIRALVPFYADDRPMADDVETIKTVMKQVPVSL